MVESIESWLIMKKSENLLSIGQMSKLSGASIKSLRYYESIDLLIPAYIDSHSNYRYYTYNQIYLVGIIMFCIELDIPLQELKQFIKDKSHINYLDFLHYSKKQALDKIDTINKGLAFVDMLESQVDKTSDITLNIPFTRKLPSMKVKTYPINKNDLDHFSIIELFVDEIYDYDLLNVPMYGLLTLKNKDTSYYAFLQSPNGDLSLKKEEYLCLQNNFSMIENVEDYFDIGNKDYLAYEIEIMKEEININELTYECRVLIK